MEPSSSPGPLPGTSPDRPLWTAAAVPRLAGTLDAALKLVTAAYALLAAWQVAKALSPPLQLREDLVVAALRRRLERPAGALPELAQEARRAIYDDTR